MKKLIGKIKTLFRENKSIKNLRSMVEAEFVFTYLYKLSFILKKPVHLPNYQIPITSYREIEWQLGRFIVLYYRQDKYNTEWVYTPLNIRERYKYYYYAITDNNRNLIAIYNITPLLQEVQERLTRSINNQSLNIYDTILLINQALYNEDYNFYYSL